MARRTVVDQWRNTSALAIGICQIPRHRSAGASGECRLGPYSRGFGSARRSRAAPTCDGASQLIGSSMVSIFLRSLVFNVLFYLLLVVWMIIGIPTYVMPRWAVMSIARNWARSSIWLLGVI